MLVLQIGEESGVDFVLNANCWSFPDGTRQIIFNFELLQNICTTLLLGFQKTLLWYIENRAITTAKTEFIAFVWLVKQIRQLKTGTLERITPNEILATRAISKKSDQYLYILRPFLQKWNDLGANGVGQDVADCLNKLNIKPSPKGVAVATLDSTEGPLTDIEYEAIQTALNSAYSRNEINTSDLILCYLFMSLGSRPAQIASLKCCDLIEPTTQDGDYILKVTRAKQRGQLTRSEFKNRKLSRQIGEPLSAYAQMIRTEFSKRLKDPDNAPLFPTHSNSKFQYAPGFEFHASPETLRRRIVKLFDSLRVTSDRMVEPIPMTPTRFRRTFCTRAAEEGWPLMAIAELMDHSDTKNVEIYAGLTSRIRAEFSRKIAFDMAPLALAFAGKIIRSEEEVTRPNEASRIIDLRIDRTGTSMGSCGTHVHCGFSRPIACYAGCFDFEPWLDGPHEAALDYMLARRKELMTTTDNRIAAINDRAILGCAQVILRCRQILAEDSK